MDRREDMNERLNNVTERHEHASSLVNILLGIWIIISPFALNMHAPKAMWNNIIIGVLVGILALIRWGIDQRGWSWVNLLLGIWLVISPFALVLGTAAMWNNVI